MIIGTERNEEVRYRGRRLLKKSLYFTLEELNILISNRNTKTNVNVVECRLTAQIEVLQNVQKMHNAGAQSL